MAIILRLAFILNRSRNSDPTPDFTLQGKENSLQITFPKKWLNDHPLTQADLAQEVIYLEKSGFTLAYQ